MTKKSWWQKNALGLFSCSFSALVTSSPAWAETAPDVVAAPEQPTSPESNPAPPTPGEKPTVEAPVAHAPVDAVTPLAAPIVAAPIVTAPTVTAPIVTAPTTNARTISAPCTTECFPADHDTDEDGVPDRVERESGTSIHDADTDNDGVPDGVEDANRDGIVDQGETDPRIPGLFPGTNPHIPEPVMFDLVRGLGARKGEVEVNTLMVSRFHRNGSPELTWAPEVEWAFADGLAVELELPMHGRELEAVKGAFQVTLPSLPTFIHGIQLIGEYALTPRDVQTTLLYLAGARFGSFSTLWMAGARATTPIDSRDSFDVLVNPSFFIDLHEAVTVGLEFNAAAVAVKDVHLIAVPQVHWQISQRVRVQAGLGAAFEERTAPAAFTRLILE